MATPKQEKLITLLLENLGSGNTRTFGDMMLEAGYSENQAKNPYQILRSQAVKEAMSEVVSDLEQLRKTALNELKARDLEKEPLRDIVKAIDIYTKNHQLLSGGNTDSNEITIKWQE